MSYKYFLEDAASINGPGNKQLMFGTNRRETTIDDIEKHISAFVEDSEVTPEEQQKGKEKFYNYLHNSGKTITVGDKIFSCKKIQ